MTVDAGIERLGFTAAGYWTTPQTPKVRNAGAYRTRRDRERGAFINEVRALARPCPRAPAPAGARGMFAWIIQFGM